MLEFVHPHSKYRIRHNPTGTACNHPRWEAREGNETEWHWAGAVGMFDTPEEGAQRWMNAGWLPVITREQWKRIHADFKGTTDGVRSAFAGSLQAVGVDLPWGGTMLVPVAIAEEL